MVSTIATALIAVATKTDTVGEGIVLGLVVGVGLAGASVMVTGSKPCRFTWTSWCFGSA